MYCGRVSLLNCSPSKHSRANYTVTDSGACACSFWTSSCRYTFGHIGFWSVSTKIDMFLSVPFVLRPAHQLILLCNIKHFRITWGRTLFLATVHGELLEQLFFNIFCVKLYRSLPIVYFIYLLVQKWGRFQIPITFIDSLTVHRNVLTVGHIHKVL